MSLDTIPDLWGPISVDVLMPIAILRNQASRLSGHTRGLLTADVRTATDDAAETHTFQIVAPSLRGYRFDLFSATHGREFFYPVRVVFQPWAEPNTPAGSLAPGPSLAHGLKVVARAIKGDEAATTEAFVELIGDVLRSTYTQSVIASLIAKSNEPATQPAA